MGVQAMKHTALLWEWTARFAECRSSGIAVKAWCKAQGLSIKTYYYWKKRVIAEANQEASVTAKTRAGALMRMNPDTLLSSNFERTNARNSGELRAESCKETRDFCIKDSNRGFQ